MTHALPPLLAGFDAKRLSEDPSTLVALDEDNVIVWVNSGWERFARENGGECVLARFGPGASYLSGIDPLLRGFFKTAFGNALVTGDRFELDYECSSTRSYRQFHMAALPLGGRGLLLVHSRLVEDALQREASRLASAAYRGSTGSVVQCANCRRVRRADGSAWDWVPAWVERSPEQASHGICPSCRGYYWGAHRSR